MKYYTVKKMNELEQHISIWVNLKNNVGCIKQDAEVYV